MKKFHSLPLPLLLLLRTSLVNAGVASFRRAENDITNGDQGDQGDGDGGASSSFAVVTHPAEGVTLVTGSTVEVRWETRGDNRDWDGHVMMEIAEAGHVPLTNFVSVDCELLAFLTSFLFSFVPPNTLSQISYVRPY